MKKSLLLGLGAMALCAGSAAFGALNSRFAVESNATVSDYTFYLQGDLAFSRANIGPEAEAWTQFSFPSAGAGDASNVAKIEGLKISSGMEFEVVAKKGGDIQYHKTLGNGRDLLGNNATHVTVNSGVDATISLYFSNDWKLYPLVTETSSYLYFTDSFWNDNRSLYAWAGDLYPYGAFPGTAFQTVIPAKDLESYKMPGVTYVNNESTFDYVYKVPTGDLLGTVNYKFSKSGEGSNYSVFQDRVFTGDSNNEWENGRLALKFVEDYMKMDLNVENQCLTLYPLAETAYGKLSADVKGVFQERFAEAYDRYVAWGAAYAAHEDSLLSSVKMSVVNGKNSFTYLAAIVGLAGLISAGAFVVIARKRKEN